MCTVKFSIPCFTNSSNIELSSYLLYSFREFWSIRNRLKDEIIFICVFFFRVLVVFALTLLYFFLFSQILNNTVISMSLSSKKIFVSDILQVKNWCHLSHKIPNLFKKRCHQIFPKPRIEQTSLGIEL